MLCRPTVPPGRWAIFPHKNQFLYFAILYYFSPPPLGGPTGLNTQKGIKKFQKLYRIGDGRRPTGPSQNQKHRPAYRPHATLGWQLIVGWLGLRVRQFPKSKKLTNSLPRRYEAHHEAGLHSIVSSWVMVIVGDGP